MKTAKQRACQLVSKRNHNTQNWNLVLDYLNTFPLNAKLLQESIHFGRFFDKDSSDIIRYTMRKLLILTFSLAVLFTACKKDVNEGPTPDTPTNMEDLKVAADFNWKTTRDIQLTLTSKTNSLAEVTSLEGASYQKAFLKMGTPYTLKFSIPSFETKVIVRYMGQSATLDLGNGTLNHQFE